MCLLLPTAPCKSPVIPSIEMGLTPPSFAGSDSTASTMQSFFWHVLDAQPVYHAVVRELDAAVRAGTIPAIGNLSWNQSQNLPYLQACLKEAMRVRPAVGLNITRLVPPEGAELDGHFFPGGTSVACNGWVLHRDKEVFGQDADDFRPERWLEDEERARKMERYMFQVSLFPILSSRECELTIGLVRRRQPSLHRPQPGAPRDQQGGPAAAARLPLRAGPPGAAAQGQRVVLCGAGGAGGVR